MRSETRARIAADIQGHGKHVIGVARSSDDPTDFLPFSYTIGNHGLGLPELLLVGGAGDLYAQILNVLGKVQRERGHALQHGELVDFTARLPARVVDAGQKGRDEYAIQAGVFYDTDDVAICQILLPDQHGRFPGDPGCLPPYSNQPVLTPVH